MNTNKHRAVPRFIPHGLPAKKMETDYGWKELHLAAILETNDDTLPDRIRAAKSAIDDRLREMQSDGGGTPEERSALGNALAGLFTLRRERLERPLIMICRICGKPLRLEGTRTDAHGKAVHEECYANEMLHGRYRAG